MDRSSSGLFDRKWVAGVMGAIVVLLAGGVGARFLMGNEKLADQIAVDQKSQDKAMQGHSGLDGHPVMCERVGHVERTLKENTVRITAVENGQRAMMNVLDRIDQNTRRAPSR